MKDPIEKYLTKQPTLSWWPLSTGDVGGVEQVVVIPCFNEYPGLFDTLEDLEHNDPEILQKTLIICVVNNRAEPYSSREEIRNNQKTLERLESKLQGCSEMRLGYIDACSGGKELPEREGVGTARKIGLDWGAHILHKVGLPDGTLINLDADTRVEQNYLRVIHDFFRSQPGWGAVVEYAHPTDTKEKEAIIQYELYLRYHEIGLRFAGSPYAFPSIGSTIVCSVRAYATVGGMCRNRAGEDFYFLQKLAKTGPIRRITETTVHPSPRPSDRVPFGTGRQVRKLLTSGLGLRVYNPESYSILKRWLHLVPHCIGETSEAVLRRADTIAPGISEFLVGQKFERVWEKFRQQSKDSELFQVFFNSWFDGFRTLRLIHFLRDEVGLEEQTIWEAIPNLFSRMNPPLPIQAYARSPGEGEPLLEDLRAVCRDETRQF